LRRESFVGKGNGRRVTLEGPMHSGLLGRWVVLGNKLWTQKRRRNQHQWAAGPAPIGCEDKETAKGRASLLTDSCISREEVEAQGPLSTVRRGKARKTEDWFNRKRS